MKTVLFDTNIFSDRNSEFFLRNKDKLAQFQIFGNPVALNETCEGHFFTKQNNRAMAQLNNMLSTFNDRWFEWPFDIVQKEFNPLGCCEEYWFKSTESQKILQDKLMLGAKSPKKLVEGYPKEDMSKQTEFKKKFKNAQVKTFRNPLPLKDGGTIRFLDWLKANKIKTWDDFKQMESKLEDGQLISMFGKKFLQGVGIDNQGFSLYKLAPNSFPYFDLLMKGMLFAFWYHTDSKNKVDEGAFEDLLQLMLMKNLDCFVSNDKKFVPPAFRALYGDTKNIYTLSEFKEKHCL